LEELMVERKLSVDHVTIWRWVQRYAPELNRRCRPELRMTNRSWRVDETYLRVAANGLIYIGQSTPQVPPSTSCFLPSAMQMRPSASFRKHYNHQIILGHE
jgi:hypothetical protein